MSPPPQDDYYLLLGVDAGANKEELHKAWRGLAARWHPDRAGQDAAAMFLRVSAAYAVLSDPLARAAYDRRRRGGAPATVGAAAPRSAAATPARPPAPAVMLSRISGNL